MTVADIPLSVLDLAPVGEGSSATEALRASVALAREVERLGYHRFWVAEHHNMPGIASSAPAVLLAHAASVTSTIRIGSGGVMLPNHAPLVVAEQFGMLEALHPGRVDLGIGRAPGTDGLTASALRRSRQSLAADDFPEQFGELRAFFTGGFPDDHPYRRITAVPGEGHQPAIWLLGSSDYSAQVAGLLGLPFSFAHHFASQNTMPALEAYRSTFRPSEVEHTAVAGETGNVEHTAVAGETGNVEHTAVAGETGNVEHTAVAGETGNVEHTAVAGETGHVLSGPYAMLGVAVVCAETEQQAKWLAGPAQLAFLRLRSGRPGRYPTPEEAAGYNFTPAEREQVKGWYRSHVVGSPESVRQQLDELVARTGVDELMITTMTHGADDRRRSYQLLAEVAGLRPTEPSSLAAS